MKQKPRRNKKRHNVHDILYEHHEKTRDRSLQEMIDANDFSDEFIRRVGMVAMWKQSNLFSSPQAGTQLILKKHIGKNANRQTLKLRTKGSEARSRRLQENNLARKHAKEVAEKGNSVEIAPLEKKRTRGRPPKPKQTDAEMKSKGYIVMPNSPSQQDASDVRQHFAEHVKFKKTGAAAMRKSVYPKKFRITAGDDQVTIESSKHLDLEINLDELEADVKEFCDQTAGMAEGREQFRSNRNKTSGEANIVHVDTVTVIEVEKKELEKRRGDNDMMKVVSIKSVPAEVHAKEAKSSAVVTDGGRNAVYKNMPLDDVIIEEFDEDGKLIRYTDTAVAKKAAKQPPKDPVEDYIDTMTMGLDDELMELLNEEISTPSIEIKPMGGVRMNTFEGPVDISWSAKTSTCVVSKPDGNAAEMSESSSHAIPIVIGDLNQSGGVGESSTAPAVSAINKNFYSGPPPAQRNQHKNEFYHLEMNNNLMIQYLMTRMKADIDPAKAEQMEDINEEKCKLILMREVSPDDEVHLLKEPRARLSERRCMMDEECYGMKIYDHHKCILKEWLSAGEIDQFYKNAKCHRSDKRHMCYLCYHIHMTIVATQISASLGAVKNDEIVGNLSHKTGMPNGFSVSACMFPGDGQNGLMRPLVMVSLNMYKPTSYIEDGEHIRGFISQYPRAQMDMRLNFPMGMEI
jgi:hypothetical protein